MRAVSSALCLAALMAAPPLAVADDDEAPLEDTAPKPRGGVGIAPGSLQLGDLVVPTDTGDGFTASDSQAFAFQFRGFLRIPLRIGLGTDDNLPDGVRGGTKMHTPPHIPDGTYTDWQYTNSQSSAWTEMVLSYGNQRVVANVILAAYDVTDSSYRNPQSQLGISQSFVTIKAPDLFGDRGGLVWNVGGFTSRYGAAGRYDAGKYDTYLFGATHAAGETVTAWYVASPELTLHAEHGIGAKLDVTPLVPGVPPAPYFPYPGEVQQGDTFLHHAHLGATWKDLTFAVHYLTSWTDDAREAGQVDGRITTAGAELKLLDSRFGDSYLGYGILRSRNPARVAGAIEALHTFEGWNLQDNYYGGGTGNGTIHTVLLQHTFSLARWNWHPQPFWGQAPDLLVALFGMYNRVTSVDAGFSAPSEKLKLGTELTYTAKPWIGFGARYDLVQPDMDDNTESFHVISPKLVLRTQFASHEEIVLQYSRYVLGDNTRLGWPHEGLAPDTNVFKISAVMWW